MMTARAKIEWLEENKIPPVLLEKERVRANSYSPTIVFKGQYNKPVWGGNICSVSIWSSVIFNESIEGNVSKYKRNGSISTITYLFEKAPFELLQVGAEFELYEGASKVAAGKIIEEIN